MALLNHGLVSRKVTALRPLLKTRSYLRAEFNLYMASLEHISNTPGLPNLDGTQTAEGYDLGRSTAFQDYHHSHAVISGLLSNLHSDLEDCRSRHYHSKVQ